MKENKKTKIADIALIITGVVWGTGFIGTEYAIETGATASLIVAMRFTIATIILLLLYRRKLLGVDKKTLIVGSVAGVALFGGFYLQTLGQSMTTVSNSSFLTATNVVMVPFIAWFFTKKAPKLKYVILAFTTFLGAGVLALNIEEGFSFQMGDTLVLASALCFALHIAFLGVYGKDKDAKQMTFLQMASLSVCAILFILLFEPEVANLTIIKKAIPSTTYLAIFSSCLCYYIQTKAQQYTSPSKAAIFLSTEGFFGSVFAVLLGIDMLSINLFLGGGLIIGSVILSEVDFSTINAKKHKIMQKDVKNN